MASVNLYNAESFLTAVNAATAEGLNAAAPAQQRAITRTLNQRGGGARSQPGQPPANQTGSLMRSWMNIQPATVTNLVARVYSTDPRSRWLERGVHIRPKNGKLLVFPVHPAAARYVETNSSIPGQPGDRLRIGLVVMRLVMQGVLRAVRTVKGGFVYVKNAGPRSKNRDGEVWFVAVPSVDIAPRPYVKRSIEAAKEDRARAFHGAFRRRFNQTAPGGVRAKAGAP